MGTTIDLDNSGSSATGSTSFTEQTVVTVFSSATFTGSSPDTNKVDKITVAISGFTGTMSLAATIPAGMKGTITNSYNNATGVLTISSTSSSGENDSNWQSILRSVTYRNRCETREF